MKKPSLHQETLHQETLHQETLHQEILHQETLHQETLHQETLHQETLHQEILHQETLFQEIFTSRNLNCVHNPQQTKPHMKKMFLSQTLGREVFIQCECRGRSAARKDCQEAQDTREEELHQDVTSASAAGGAPRGVRGVQPPARVPREEYREVSEEEYININLHEHRRRSAVRLGDLFCISFRFCPLPVRTSQEREGEVCQSTKSSRHKSPRIRPIVSTFHVYYHNLITQ